MTIATKPKFPFSVYAKATAGMLPRATCKRVSIVFIDKASQDIVDKAIENIKLVLEAEEL